MEDASGTTPLELALRSYGDPEPNVWVGAKFSAIALAYIGPQLRPKAADRVFARLEKMGDRGVQFYPFLASNWYLTAAGWDEVPTPCPFIGFALPEVLRRSEAMAALLVQHMTEGDRQHLRTLALCLGAAQRRGRLPQLPVHIVHRLLAESAAEQASGMGAYWAKEDKRRLRRGAIKELRKLLLTKKPALAPAVLAVLAAIAWKLCILLWHVLLFIYRCF